MEQLEQLVILKVESYHGEDTWLEVGGDGLTEESSHLDATDGDGVMYALIHLEGNDVQAFTKGTSDFGYPTVAEARKAAERLHPGIPIAVVE